MRSFHRNIRFFSLLRNLILIRRMKVFRTPYYLILVVALMATFGASSVFGQAPSFSIRGKVTEADGTAVGAGYTVKAVNQEVSGWSIYTDGKTRANGSYTDITFIDFFGKTTDVGHQIVLTVVERTQLVKPRAERFLRLLNRW